MCLAINKRANPIYIENYLLANEIYQITSLDFYGNWI